MLRSFLRPLPSALSRRGCLLSGASRYRPSGTPGVRTHVVSSVEGRHATSKEATPGTAHHECGNCSKWVNCCTFFCPSCNSLLPPDVVRSGGQNCGCSYFDILDVPKQFSLDAKQLERKYWDLQKTLHPDKFGTHSEQQQTFSAEHCALVNKAYNTLKEPVDRAKYLLAVKGHSVLEEGEPTLTDPSLLMEVMERREELEDCESLDEVDALQEEVSAEVAAIEQALDASFLNNQNEEAKSHAVKLKYYSKIAEEIKSKRLALEVGDDA